MTIIVAVGLWDDIKGMSAPAKVTATVVAGLALVWFGVTMYYFRLPFPACSCCPTTGSRSSPCCGCSA